MSNIDFFSKWRWKQPEKHVSINVMNAIELKKDSTYILLVDDHAISREGMQSLMDEIRRQGIRNVVGFMMSGNPDDSIQIIEDKPKAPKGKKSHATSKARH